MANKHWDFLGGSLEAIEAGEADIPDEVTGQTRHVEWPNHVRVITRSGRAKLNRGSIKGIIENMEKEPDFREWVDQCP